MRVRVTPSAAAAFEWQATAEQFRVGRSETCALRFQGDAGATVSWEHAEFLLTPDGKAYVTDLRSSNGTFVDGARIVAQTRVRVGSSIQLGKTGPRLEILDLNAVPATNVAPGGNPSASPAAAAANRSEPRAAHVPAPPPAEAASGWFVQHLGSFTAVIVILTLGFFVWSRSPQPDAAPAPPPEARPAAPPATTPPREVAAASEPAEKKQPVNPLPANPQPDIPVNPPAQPKETKSDPWQEAREQGTQAYRLIVVEDPKTRASWPFAGAIVVHERALLTTAGVANELAKFVERGWDVAAVRTDLGSRVTIKTLRVHAAYGQESPEKQLYFDIAVLSTADSLGQPITLASPAELAQLENGEPLLCLAIDHTGEPLDRFQPLELQSYPNKIFAITSLPPQPGGPRLLHVRGSFTPKAAGSPILNRQGHLVAVYCEPAPSPTGASKDLHLNYVKVIEPQLIELATTGSDQQVWVPAKPTATPNTSPEVKK